MMAASVTTRRFWDGFLRAHPTGGEAFATEFATECFFDFDFLTMKPHG